MRWLKIARETRGFSGGRFSIEDLSDFLREVFQVERLLKEGDASFQDAMAEDAIVGVARDIKNFDFGPCGGDSSDEFAPTEPRHHYIGDENVNRSSVDGGGFERLDAVGCFENTITGFAEIVANQLTDTFLVLHEQDGFCARLSAA